MTQCGRCGDTITRDEDGEWAHDSGTAWHLADPEMPHLHTRTGYVVIQKGAFYPDGVVASFWDGSTLMDEEEATRRADLLNNEEGAPKRYTVGTVTYTFEED